MSKMEVDRNGNKIWRNSKGMAHREDGPALEYASGSKTWYIDGNLHREDGPASEHSDGEKNWYINGRLHRVDGPAVEDSMGKKTWFLYGNQYSFDDWLGQLQVSDEEKVMLCLIWK